MSKRHLCMTRLAMVLCLVSCGSGVSMAATAVASSIFPPTNIQAGGGLLFFPQGGNNSLYAVPVLSDQSLLNAVAAQTEAINRQTAVLTQQVAVLQSLASKVGASSISPIVPTVSPSSVPQPIAIATAPPSGTKVSYPSAVSCSLSGTSLSKTDQVGTNYALPETQTVTVPFYSNANNVYSYKNDRYELKGYTRYCTSIGVCRSWSGLSSLNMFVQVNATYDAMTGKLLNAGVSGNTAAFSDVKISCPASL